MATRQAAPNPISVKRRTRRGARNDVTAAPAKVGTAVSPAPDVVMFVLEERCVQHTIPTADRRGDRPPPMDRASARLAALHLACERRGAIALERHRRAPTNVARNYYDGGCDFAIEHTVQLTFASVDTAVDVLTAAKPALAAWLAPRGAHTAALYLDAVELILDTEDDVDRALSLLARIADAGLR